MTAFCGRKYDELTINKAIAKAVEEDKSVYLLGGNYRIDDFYDFGDGGAESGNYTKPFAAPQNGSATTPPWENRSLTRI